MDGVQLPQDYRATTRTQFIFYHMEFLKDKTTFFLMARDSKSHAIILEHESSIKLNISKKIEGLEIMIINREKNLAPFQSYRTYV